MSLSLKKKKPIRDSASLGIYLHVATSLVFLTAIARLVGQVINLN